MQHFLLGSRCFAADMICILWHILWRSVSCLGLAIVSVDEYLQV
jgi:hypothetical protein